MEILLGIAGFGTAMAAMGIGVILSDRSLRGSCGGPDVLMGNGEAISCGACPKKEADVCASDDDLVGLAQIAYPNSVRRHH